VNKLNIGKPLNISHFYPLRSIRPEYDSELSVIFEFFATDAFSKRI